MAQALDVGLHIVLTRRSGGAARSLYDPIIQTMTELGSTGVMPSGSPDQGQLIGRFKSIRSVLEPAVDRPSSPG
jgi:S-DNA-T family DNA segregation ATPase FtsK/SpoIIIE